MKEFHERDGIAEALLKTRSDASKDKCHQILGFMFEENIFTESVYFVVIYKVKRLAKKW